MGYKEDTRVNAVEKYVLQAINKNNTSTCCCFVKYVQS